MIHKNTFQNGRGFISWRRIQTYLIKCWKWTVNCGFQWSPITNPFTSTLFFDHDVVNSLNILNCHHCANLWRRSLSSANVWRRWLTCFTLSEGCACNSCRKPNTSASTSSGTDSITFRISALSCVFVIPIYTKILLGMSVLYDLGYKNIIPTLPFNSSDTSEPRQ